ncbi:hypothetical protein, partial [Lacticaseibacillus rhamnosus]|uniref:hypothetical protein n=1 Tax=Lacticaseibacillus rhamnosus TaxID=47715 RepID=UPI001CDD7043
PSSRSAFLWEGAAVLVVNLSLSGLSRDVRALSIATEVLTRSVLRRGPRYGRKPDLKRPEA